MRRGQKEARRSSTVALLALLFAALGMVLPSQALAHNDLVFYLHRWQASVHSPGVWLYASPLFGATEQSRIKDAFRQWNDQPPTIWFNYKGIGTFTESCSSPRNRNTVDWYPELPTSIARTNVCFDAAGGMDRFWIWLDVSDPWYTGGSAGGIPSGKFDFWSALTHEYGHGLAFGVGGGIVPEHFTDSTACPSNKLLFNTLCTGQQTIETFWRTLESHDVHTFDQAY